MSSRAPRLFHYEEELRSAERALDTKLYRACILHCVLAVEAFVWDLLWGNDHVGVVFPPGTNPVPYQTVDLIFQYVRPCVDEHGKPAPVYPPDYQVGHPELKPYMEAFRKANKKLFRNGSDGLLLAQAVRTGVVSGRSRVSAKASHHT